MPPALSNHISHVVACEFPTHAMGRAFPAISYSEQAVSGIGGRRNPLPTGVGRSHSDICPKSGFNFLWRDRYAMADLSASWRAIPFARLPRNGARLNGESTAACFAFEDNPRLRPAVPAQCRAKSRRGVSLTKRLTANLAGRIAVFERRSHAAIIMLTDELSNIANAATHLIPVDHDPFAGAQP